MKLVRKFHKQTYGKEYPEPKGAAGPQTKEYERCGWGWRRQSEGLGRGGRTTEVKAPKSQEVLGFPLREMGAMQGL